MNIGLLTRNENAWCSSRLTRAFRKRGVAPVCFTFHNLAAKIFASPSVTLRRKNILNQIEALLVRPIGRGSLDEIIFRLNLLHSISRTGLPIVNPPQSIEKAADKYHTLTLLAEAGIKVPRTVVTENVSEAIQAFRQFEEDVVVKPVFGSRGIGIARISNGDIAERVFRTLRFNRHVIYVQEFIQHGTRDIRVFVIGFRVVAAMFRVADSWKTNVSRGAKPTPLKWSSELEELAVKSSRLIGTEIAGIDLLESPNDLLVTEVNSQPGWRGLQSATRTNIADEIAGYMISKTKK